MRLSSALAAAALCLLSAGSVRAGGLELLPGGSQSVARGGAVAARPENPMTLLINPAGMARLRGDQLLLNIDFPIHDMCVQPYGYYGWGVYPSLSGAVPEENLSEFGDPEVVEFDDDGNPIVGATYATDRLDEVCNSGRITGVPNLAWTSRLSDRLAIGLGFVAPTLIGGMQYGGEDGTIAGRNGARPTPTRYQMVRQEVSFGLNPTAGVAYRVLDSLAVGATLQVFMVAADSWVVMTENRGNAPDDDHMVKLEARDFFIPALVFSFHSNPVRGLDLMASFRWSDGFDGSGDVTYTTNTYHRGAEVGPIPFENESFALDRVAVGLPWVLIGGVRYAGLIGGEDPEGRDDPMAQELWDVELDAAMTFSERAGTNSVLVGEDVSVNFRRGDGDFVEPFQADQDMFDQLDVERHLKDSVAVRVGGSFAAVPRTLQIHAGTFYETRGVEPDFASVDTFAFQRVGVGAGVMLRLGSFDLTAAYAHIFSEELNLAPPPHQNRQDADPDDPQSGFDQRVGGVVLEDPDAPDPADADGVASFQQSSLVQGTGRPERPVNAGKYTAAFDVISVGVNYHF